MFKKTFGIYALDKVFTGYLFCFTNKLNKYYESGCQQIHWKFFAFSEMSVIITFDAFVSVHGQSVDIFSKYSASDIFGKFLN